MASFLVERNRKILSVSFVRDQRRALVGQWGRRVECQFLLLPNLGDVSCCLLHDFGLRLDLNGLSAFVELVGGHYFIRYEFLVLLRFSEVLNRILGGFFGRAWCAPSTHSVFAFNTNSIMRAVETLHFGPLLIAVIHRGSWLVDRPEVESQQQAEPGEQEQPQDSQDDSNRDVLFANLLPQFFVRLDVRDSVHFLR